MIGDVVRMIGSILVLSIPLMVSVWALLDAARRPAWAFALAGRSRTVWVALGAAGVFVCAAGVVVAVYYLVRVRPVVAAVEAGRLT